jgi:uncharacterized repeat protein (TIGR02543 family)
MKFSDRFSNVKRPGRLLTAALIAIVVVALVATGVAAATVFALNKTLPATVTVIPAPVPTYYQLVLSANPTEGGSAGSAEMLSGGSHSYLAGTVVRIEATPLSGYQFTGWTGDLVSTTNPVDVTMSNNKTIIAHFALVPVAANLYTDAAATLPFDGTLNFGTNIQGSVPVITGLSSGGLYVRTTEIAITSLVCVTNGLPGNAQVTMTAGTPDVSGIVLLTFTLPSNLPVGLYDFTVTITGLSD